MDALPQGSTTHSTYKTEARKKALVANGLPADAIYWDILPVPDRNPETQKNLEIEARTNPSCWEKLNLMVEVYWHPDGYFVCLRPDTARSYDERREKGNSDTSGAQKAHYNVYYEKDGGIEETDQHHTFDIDDDPLPKKSA